MISTEEFKLVLVFGYSFVITFIAAEYFQRKFRSKGFEVKDYYKKNKPNLPNLGGTAALVGIMASIVLSQVIVHEFSTSQLLIFFFIVIIHAVFGLIDDLINTSNLIKIVAPYFMALPIALLVTDGSLTFGNYSLQLGLVFIYLIAPVYLLVVTNLVNMHSGFNGLASGLSVILLSSLGIRAYIHGQTGLLFYLLPILGAALVLWNFDRCPARMIWGNIGSMLTGSAIGAFIIVSKAEIFGIIILIPHIVDFLLYLISMIILKKKFATIKFGKLRKNGTIAAPTAFKMKFLIPYFFKVTEKQIVWMLYGITILFCSIGIMSGL